MLDSQPLELEAWLSTKPPEEQEAIRQQLSQDSDELDIEAGQRQWIVSSRGLVAEFFGVSTQTVKDWKSNGMPGSAGKWNLKDIRQWQDLRREENAQIIGDRFAPVRGAILEEDHRGRKLKNDELASELVPVADVRRAITAWAMKLRLRIMSIPGDLALLVPGELKSIVKSKSDNTVRLALKEISEMKLTGQQVEEMIIEEAERLKQKRKDA